MNQIFYKKLLNKIQNDRPEDVSSFIENNGLDVVETLEKIAIIPINYKLNVKDQDIDIKFFPLIYPAVLNEKYSLEMVMWLHKHMPIAICYPIMFYDMDPKHAEYRSFKDNQDEANSSFIQYAADKSKIELLNYLLSFERVDCVNNWEYFNLPEDIQEQRQKLFEAQKTFIENNNYLALMDAMENLTLVYSVLELAKDNDFIEFCQANGSDLVRVYMDNATYELDFSDDPYNTEDDLYMNDPDLKDKTRGQKNVSKALKNTKRNSVQEINILNLSSTHTQEDKDVSQEMGGVLSMN